MEIQNVIDEITTLYNKVETLTKERDELRNTLNGIVKFTNVPPHNNGDEIVNELFSMTNDMNLANKIAEGLKDDNLNYINGLVSGYYMHGDQQKRIMLYGHKYRLKNGAKGKHSNEKMRYSRDRIARLTQELSDKSSFDLTSLY